MNAVPGYEFLGGLTDEELLFRVEFLDWLADHLVGEFARLRGKGGPADDEAWAERVAWEKELGLGRWRGILLPIEYGGRGFSTRQNLIFEYEYAKAHAPYRPSLQSEALFAPTLLKFGQPEQCATILEGILKSREFWCQGFSEPDAGSDLASLRTSAELIKNQWVVNGSKIWTTLAHRAQWIYLLCRTHRSESKHAGITMLLVPLNQEGVEIRSIRTLAGHSDFNEVFFKDAVTVRGSVLGKIDKGWNVAMAMLAFERGTAMLGHQMGFEREFEMLLEEVRLGDLANNAWARQSLAKAWIGMRILRLHTTKVASQLAEGKELGSEVSLLKLGAANWHQRFGELEMELIGMKGTIVESEYALTSMQKAFLNGRAETIYGGSNEIQRNIIGERILGLPRA